MLFPVILKVLAASVAFLSGLRRAALFLGMSLFSDIAWLLFGELRKGYPRPFTGWGLVLWLPDPATTLAIPSVVFGAVFGWKKGLALWAIAFLAVFLEYPRVRGDALLRCYWAFYGAVYLITSIVITFRSVTRKISKEEALLLLFGLVGLGDVVLLKLFGMNFWWAIWTINGSAYISTLVVGAQELRRRRREDSLPKV